MLRAPDIRRWPPADSYINNLFLAATHQQIRMKMTDKDNEQSKYWRTDQKNNNRPVITHKLHNIKKSRVTALLTTIRRDAFLQAASSSLVLEFYISLRLPQLSIPVEHWLLLNVIPSSILPHVFKMRLNITVNFLQLFFLSRSRLICLPLQTQYKTRGCCDVLSSWRTLVRNCQQFQVPLISPECATLPSWAAVTRARVPVAMGQAQAQRSAGRVVQLKGKGLHSRSNKYCRHRWEMIHLFNVPFPKWNPCNPTKPGNLTVYISRTLSPSGIWSELKLFTRVWTLTFIESGL